MKLTTLLLALLLISCGSRHVNKEEKKTDSTATATQVIKTDSTSTDSTSIKFDVVSEEIIIEAVDSTKPIEIINNEGKVTKYKNARISKKKRKDNTIVVNEKSVSKIVVDSLTNEIEVNKIESTKIVYKEQFNWGTFLLQLWWLWLLIIIAIYLAYRYYKGYLKFPLL
jgi:PBP1b-binding outer membrane lipoprotein LpoB